MANEFVAKNGVIAQNNSVITGSLVITNGITGSLFGTSSQALSASFAALSPTASYINPLNQTVSVTGSLSVSSSAGTAFFSNADTLLISGSLVITGSASITGSLNVTAGVVGYNYLFTDGQYIRNSNQSNANGNLYLDSSNLYIRRADNGTNLMFVSSSGNVGIGTTSPVSILDLRTGAGTSGNILNLSNTTGAAAGNIVPIRFYSGNTFGGLEQTAAIWGINPNAGTNNGGALVFATSTNGTGTTPTEKVRISNSGQTTFSSPSSIIANNQGIRVYSTDSQAADLGGGISFGGNYVGTSTTADFANIKSGKDNSTSGNYAGYLAFSTNAQATGNVERMRILSGGAVLIGTTSLALNERQNLTYPGVENQGFVINQTSSAGANDKIIFQNSNGIVGFIRTDGSATTYNTTSDYRLKQDLKDYEGLEIINSIKTYDFEWKSDNRRMHGVMAHELAEVVPYSVIGEKDGEQMQAVDYSKLVPILVKAIQEQQAQVESQNTLIQELTTRLTALENK